MQLPPNTAYDNLHAAQKEAEKEKYEERMALGEMPIEAEVEEFGRGIISAVLGPPLITVTFLRTLNDDERL